jgi:hypothetical protein
VEVLSEAAWRERARAHEARVDALLAPHLERRRGGLKHPVHDFLFTYYSFRPAQLRRWHPGHGVVLADGPSPITDEYVAERRDLIEANHTLLTATAARPPHFGCFGMHEWAMVYRSERVRHEDWPLRLGAAGTNTVVENHRVACSHFDAYRFFTPEARPRNELAPTSTDRPAFEQPACLHAGMDLYKHAFRLSPMIASELVVDCFELACDIRVLDMRASPYDLTDLGYNPVRVETPEGKQEYVAAQREFAERARPLRQRLIAECQRLMASYSNVAIRSSEPGPTLSATAGRVDHYV